MSVIDRPIVRDQLGTFLGKASRRLPEIATAVFVVMLVTFLAHFVFYPFFGLYEDDYILTLPTMDLSWHDFDWWLVNSWLHPLMGRPLNHFLRYIFCFFTVRHGHLGAGFLLSWVLVSANGALLYGLIRRILPYAPALIGALVFVLFPIDTSRQILMIQTDILVPILLLLVCFHLYLSGRYVMAYALITLSMLDLESFLPPFLAAPFLAAGIAGIRSWKSFLKKLFVHGLILGILFGVVAMGRLALGEQRARDLSLKPIDTIGRMIRLGTEGPFHSFVALIQRPIDGASNLNATLWPYVFIAVVVIVWGLSRAQRPEKEAESSSSAQGSRRPALIVVLGGLVIWSLGYVLWVPSDYFPPDIDIGRMSAEHAAAAVGAGLVSAGLATWVLSISANWKRLLGLAFCCYCGALVAFSVQIQLTQYVAYWDETKRFWSTLLNQIRDVQDGEVVLVEQSSDNRVMPVTQAFGEYSQEGYFPFALPYFVDFPNRWAKGVPKVFGLWKGCTVDDLGDSIRIHAPSFAGPAYWPTVRSGNFIYFRARNGVLERVTDSVTIEGHQLQPKPAPTQDLPPLPLSKTYLNLTAPVDAKHWPTLLNAKNYP
jgi:hypothetical protein